MKKNNVWKKGIMCGVVGGVLMFLLLFRKKKKYALLLKRMGLVDDV